ncbi:MAG TPA: SRPBCC domain-containing protein [bacterium]
MGQNLELIIVRDFAAPREALWQAWTEAERVRRWWGSRHFTSPFSSIDLRVGGSYLHCIRTPDGREYWSTGVYREFVPPEKLVLTDSFADERGNVVPATYYGLGEDFPSELLVTVTFKARDRDTTMTLRHAGVPSKGMLEQMREGWNGSFDKLDDLLARH